MSLPKYLSGMSSGIRTSNKRTQLAVQAQILQDPC
jgi:hypothetical protein